MSLFCLIDLHKLLYDTGIKGKNSLFMLSDEQLIDDVCFYYLSEVLILGLPVDIFTQEELKMASNIKIFFLIN